MTMNGAPERRARLSSGLPQFLIHRRRRRYHRGLRYVPVRGGGGGGGAGPGGNGGNGGTGGSHNDSGVGAAGSGLLSLIGGRNTTHHHHHKGLMSNIIPNLSTPFPYADTIQIGNDVSPGRRQSSTVRAPAIGTSGKATASPARRCGRRATRCRRSASCLSYGTSLPMRRGCPSIRNISPRLPSSWHRGASHSQL